MANRTILFESVAAAREAGDILQPMIDTTIDCNAITYDDGDKELVSWLVQKYYFQLGDRATYIYPKPKSILLVDDDRNLLLLLQDYLEYKSGIKINIAESAEAGWQTYCRIAPDLVVSGIAMETVDSGYSFLQQIRERDPKQPFVVLSSQMSVPGKTEKAIELGANCCFSKPFEPEELLSSIERLLNK